MSHPALAPASLIAAALLACAPNARAAITINPARATVLYNFQGYPADGNDPQGSLTAGPAGTLYGTTVYGGPSNGGTVFQLAPPTGGQTSWTETLLHSFSGADGAFPAQTMLTDSAGNLYGATQIGGANGLGGVFELSPPTTGTGWTFNLLYSFAGPDGATPFARLTMDAAGNLYGVTAYGGTTWTSGEFTGQGVVYQLSPPSGAQTTWTQSVLHYFAGSDGQTPIGGLALDTSGNLYGAASGGGTCCGVVFEVSPPTRHHTAWTESVIHNFTGGDGYGPSSSLSIDAAGDLFGTTSFDGPHGNGVVFKLAPPARTNGMWHITIVHGFTGLHGADPSGDLTLDGAGNVFTTTPSGGINGRGAVFEFSPPSTAHGQWPETVFLGGRKAGANPHAGIILGAGGAIYGVSSTGGTASHGTIFQLSH